MTRTATRHGSSPAHADSRSAKAGRAHLILPCALGAALWLAGCATAPEVQEAPPPEPAAPVAVVAKDHSAELRAAHESYAQAQYGAAVATLDAVIADPEAQPAARRQAHLARALVFVGPDPALHSLANAKAALQSAAAIAPDAADSQSLVLAATLERLIAAETSLSEVNGKLATATRERAALAAERTQLRAEQEKLKAALEKMKNLTLGE